MAGHTSLEYLRAWRQAHRQLVQEYSRRWKEEHPERRRALNRASRVRRREHRLAYDHSIQELTRMEAYHAGQP